MGWSEGGQYALAVANALGDRVTGCAVIAGCLPLDDPDTFKQLNNLDRAFARLARQGAARAPRRGSVPSQRRKTCWWGPFLRASVRGQPNDEATAVREQGCYALSILDTILGGGMSSRLFQEVREKRGLAYSVYSFQQSYRETGLFGFRPELRRKACRSASM